MSTNEDVQPGKLMMDLLMESLTVRLSAMNGRPPGAPWKVFSFVLAEGKYGKIWKKLSHTFCHTLKIYTKTDKLVVKFMI